jgi:hypothetical protein
MMPMGKKAWFIVGVIGFFLVVFLGWKAFSSPNDRDSLAFREQEEKIRDMEDRLARLQQELEESSKQVASLQGGSQGGSDETTRAHRFAQRKLNNSRREENRLAGQSHSTETSFYEAVRSTSVFEEPSASSREVATISKGSRIRVVGSTGDWLEVRSRQGRPPGFIRRDDAVVMR